MDLVVFFSYRDWVWIRISVFKILVKEVIFLV